MNILYNDLLYSLALKLDLPDLINFCNTSKRINKNICNTNRIWQTKLDQDFPDRHKLKGGPENLKNLYILLWNLVDVKKKLNLHQDIYTLYSLKKIRLSHKNLKEIPKSIEFLNNLEELALYSSGIQKIPEKFPISLKELLLTDNEIKELPDLLSSSLTVLEISRNRLEKLPKILPYYLENLYADDNKLTYLPDKLPIFLKGLSVINNLLPQEEINRIRQKYPKLLILTN